MPELVTFKNRRLQRRRGAPDGQLELTFYSPHPGTARQKQKVTQQEWAEYGKAQFYPKEKMPDVRALARQAVTSS